MGVHETIKDIKGQFRLFMNGVASQSMREKGLDYKLNFGIELPRLKEIAWWHLRQVLVCRLVRPVRHSVRL